MASQGFGRFSKPATPAPTAESAPLPPEPAPATPAPAAVAPAAPAPAPVVASTAPSNVVATPKGSFAALALGKAPITVRNVLSAVVEEADTGSTLVETFPTIVLKGGNSGGAVIPTKSTMKSFPDVANQLPQGMMAITGVLMGIRAEVIAWPAAMDEDESADAAKPRPSMSFAIPFDKPADISRLVQACDNFQYAPRDQKAAKWDVASGGPGHPRPIFQMLVWLPTVKECVVVQCSALMRTFQEMSRQITVFTDEATGELAPVPVQLTPTTAPWYDANVFHYFKAAVKKDRDMYDAYSAWVGDVQANRPDIAQTVMEWLTGADKAPDEAAMEKLQRGANMVNPRRQRRS